MKGRWISTLGSLGVSDFRTQLKGMESDRASEFRAQSRTAWDFPCGRGMHKIRVSHSRGLLREQADHSDAAEESTRGNKSLPVSQDS